MPRLRSILSGSNAEVFKNLLMFYKKPPARIIDVTCGQKHFWDLMKGSINQPDLFGIAGYSVTFSDERPIGDMQEDYRFISDKHPEFRFAFDVIVFDPPYVPLSLKVDGVDKWIGEEDRYGMAHKQEELLTKDDLRRFVVQAYMMLKPDGVVIVKLQDTVNFWHFKFWEVIHPFELEALYIHDLGQNWAENVEVKNAKKPIPVHAYWFILTKKRKEN
jgi:hypothetical protein